MYNLRDLQWQWDWRQGPRLRNLMIQVCPTCLDVPQENGRTIILPPDPVPVAFPLPEDYAAADNPASYLGYNVANAFFPQPPQSLGGNIGNMTLNAGVNAAFDSATNKRAELCAALSISNSSFQNTVGKNWSADPSGTSLTITSTVSAITHIVASIELYAPNDQAFLNSATGITGYALQGSANGATWTTIISGTTAGGAGETITASATSAAFYQYHQIAIEGDGVSAVAIAQAIMNISDAAANDI
jgi:hypothetical protein